MEVLTAILSIITESHFSSYSFDLTVQKSEITATVTDAIQG